MTAVTLGAPSPIKLSFRYLIELVNNVRADHKVPLVMDDEYASYLRECGINPDLPIGLDEALMVVSRHGQTSLGLAIIRRLLTPRTVPRYVSEVLAAASATAEHCEELERQISEMMPKVEFADRVAGTGGASIDNYAKAVGIKPLALFTWLRDNGILQDGGRSHNLPKQRYLDSRYFMVAESTQMLYGGSKAVFTPLITGRGQIWLTGRLRGSLLKVEAQPLTAEEWGLIL